MELVLYKGRPADCTGRLEKEIRTYDLLDALGLEYWRTDHAFLRADTMEDCMVIDDSLAATVCKIHEYLIEQDITDGVCGYRELENWVLSYMVSNDLRRSAWTALLSKASMDREEQETMERVFLLPHCDVD